MDPPREKGGRSIFIGNIPYGVSEEQIQDIFGRIGPVIGFRLVYDKETGKPKGYGFLEYPDPDHSAAAIRNLNGYEIMGRQLKVDYSNDNSAGKQQNNQSNRAPPPPHFDMSNAMGAAPQMNGGGPQAGELPPLPQGVNLPPGFTATDAISKTLSEIPPPQLLDIVSQMKNLVQSNPQQATQLLQSAPQLSYAIFQALLLLGLVDTNVVGQLVQQTGQQPQQQAPPPQPQPPMQYPPPQPPQQQYNQPPPNPYTQQKPPQPYQHSGYNPTPPIQHQPYQPPPQQQPTYQQQPPQPQPQQGQDQNQAALIQQVLNMSREQIYALDEGPRNQILALRTQLGHPVS